MVSTLTVPPIDPDPYSVILWTRHPFAQGTRQLLTVEVAEDEAFRRVIAHAQAPVSSAADWTARVLIGGLKPARTYWYRFTDTDGNGSRVGRTITAPLPNDPRTVNFAFVSCQDVNEGKLNAYRRMIYEDERAAAAFPNPACPLLDRNRIFDTIPRTDGEHLSPLPARPNSQYV